jgi:hypothetical protein
LNEALYATLETDGETLEVTTLRMLPTSCATPNDISGTITSALSSSVTIDNATINVYKNYWTKRSLAYSKPSAVKTVTTPANGTYTLSDMPRGWYTLLISASEYITVTRYVESCGDKTEQNKALSPTLPSNSMRVVLSWEETSPVTGTDLDSHLTGPDNVSGRFHVYYPTSGKGIFYYFENNYTCSSCSNSEKLDNVTVNRDEKASTGAPPGIETVTVSNVKSSGTYRFSVHDFNNRADTNSDNLSISGASVNVDYNDGSTTTSKTYGVPTNKIGTLWEVFTFTTSGLFVKEKNMSNEVGTGVSIK